MKILIITAWYHPFIHPRAHRWTALAEHWADQGHEVHVLTARVSERGDSEVFQKVQVHRVGFDSLKEWVYYGFGIRKARGRVGQKPGKSSPVAKLLAWVYKTVWKNLFFPDDAGVWYFPARRKLRQMLENEAFDAVITVSLPFTGHLLGLVTRHEASKRRKEAPFWLADIGDPFSFQAKPPNNLFLYGPQNLRLERRVLETADAVTVTTEATLRKYHTQFGENAVAKMVVIPPVLVPSAINNQQSSIVNHQPPIPNPPIPNSPTPQTIKLAYFGAFYAPTRTPDAFLELLTQTFVIRPELRSRLEVHFFGEIFPEFYERLSAEPAIQLHGLCSRAEVWDAMQDMDILINIGNTTDFQLPSKAVDYLATGKPILNLSFVENDPFAAFFSKDALVFNLTVEKGKISASELQRWISWLESEKPIFEEGDIAARAAPYLVENIARQYIALLEKRIIPDGGAKRSD